jgi:hypothetical protein
MTMADENPTGAAAYDVLGHPKFGGKLCVLVSNGENVVMLAGNDLRTDVHSMKQYLVMFLGVEWPVAAELVDRVLALRDAR